MSRLLVTGGAGFIGSHLVDALLARGDEVRVIDNLDPLAHPSGRPPEHLDPGGELILGDVRDRALVDRALEGVEAVVHLAGVVGNGESMVNVARAVSANALGTATVMEAVLARRDTVRRVVLASSVVVYGEGAHRCADHGRVIAASRTAEALGRRQWEPACPLCARPLSPETNREDQGLHPTSVYAITKRDQEELVLTLGRAYGLEAVALRYNNVYGPRQALGNPYTGVAAIFAARALNRRAPIVFEDGGQLRDLIHVSDAVEATMAAVDPSRSPRAPGHAINVATGSRIRILDLAREIVRLLAPGLEPHLTGEYRAGDVRHWLADPSRARELLGFQARRRLTDELPALTEWVSRQSVDERGDEALKELRARGLVA